MEFKGDIRIRRTGVFDRRADQGLRSASITTEESLNRHSAYWQSLESTSGNDVLNLPDVGDLPNGWQVVIHNIGNEDLQVLDGSTQEAIVTPDGAKRLTLLDGGDWFVENLEDAEEVSAQRFTLTHNNTSDWGSESAGYYTITTTASTHGRGTRPMIQFYETVGSYEIEVTPDRSLFVTASGDHSFRVPSDPDIRYTGKVIYI